MYNLRTNYLRIFQICKDSLYQHFVSGHNFNVYWHAPKMSDLEVVSLSITADVVGIFSENLLFSVLKTDYSCAFPNLVHRITYNRRRKKLQPYIAQVAVRMSELVNPSNNLYVLDSMPLPICETIRFPRNKFRTNIADIQPSPGYHASHRKHYYGWDATPIQITNGCLRESNAFCG